MMFRNDEDSQPDCGGNRHYDYISAEDHEAAEKTLKKKDSWRSLSTNEIVVLRAQAKDLGLVKDIIDNKDRLMLLKCLFYHCENRDIWAKKARELEKKHIERMEKDLKKG